MGLTTVFSRLRLIRGGLRGALVLPWAQEVRGSNPRAPTTYFFVFNELILILPC